MIDAQLKNFGAWDQKNSMREDRSAARQTPDSLWDEVLLWDVYDAAFWILSVPYACGAFLIFCSVCGLAPCLMWRTLKLRIRKDIFGEKGITSIPDNCVYAMFMVKIMLILWLMEVIAYTEMRNFNETLVCSYIIKCIFVLAAPAGLMLLFGESFAKFIKGEINKENKGVVGLMDISGTVSFIGRFFAQMMRYLFILVKMGLFLVLLESAVLDWRYAGGPGPYYALDNSIPVCVLIDISELIKRFIGFLVDFINVFFVFYAQIGALLIVLWWLLAALFSTIKKIWDYQPELNDAKTHEV